MKQIEYKHFLSYDMIELGFGYGITELFYDCDDSTLYLRKKDQRNGKEDEMEFSLKQKFTNDKEMLEDFLINLMSERGNFCGEPEYFKSDIFSKNEFDVLLQKAYAIMNEMKEAAIKSNLNNELIKYCTSVNLYPEPSGSNYNWQANCPSGGAHHIMISTKSNEWGCGYCRKKGDLTALKEWYEFRHNPNPK